MDHQEKAAVSYGYHKPEEPVMNHMLNTAHVVMGSEESTVLYLAMLSYESTTDPNMAIEEELLGALCAGDHTSLTPGSVLETLLAGEYAQRIMDRLVETVLTELCNYTGREYAPLEHLQAIACHLKWVAARYPELASRCVSRLRTEIDLVSDTLYAASPDYRRRWVRWAGGWTIELVDEWGYDTGPLR